MSETQINGFTFSGNLVETTDLPIYLHKKTKMEFVLLPSTSFTMGSEQGDSDEIPTRQMTLPAFLISRHAVVQRVWRKVMRNNPSLFRGAEYPVENVTWNEAQLFCKRTELMLPTEAQWEYACKAGNDNDYYWGNKEEFENYAWCMESANNTTYAVGQKGANAFGLHDMAGNVWEWCLDSYRSYSEADLPEKKNAGCRVIRGGSWLDPVEHCRSAYRYGCGIEDIHDRTLGFRVVYNIPS